MPVKPIAGVSGKSYTLIRHPLDLPSFATPSATTISLPECAFHVLTNDVS